MKTVNTIICGAALLLAACIEEPRPAPSSTRLMGSAPVERPIVQELATVPLDAQADFDELEERLRQRVAPDQLIALYETLAQDVKPASDPRDALLLQRLALIHLKSGAQSGGFQKAFTLADRLRNEAPESPHTHYLLSAITSLLVPPNSDGSYRLNPQRLDVAKRLQQHWRKLIDLAPDYIGPRGLSGPMLQKKLTALDRAINQHAQRASLAPIEVMTQDSSSGDVYAARNKLERLERGDLAARRTLCSELMEQKEVAPTSDLERWLTLSCAVELRDAAGGTTALVALVASGAITEPCRWAVELGIEPATLPAPLKAAMETRRLSPCTAK